MAKAYIPSSARDRASYQALCQKEKEAIAKVSAKYAPEKRRRKMRWNKSYCREQRARTNKNYRMALGWRGRPKEKANQKVVYLSGLALAADGSLLGSSFTSCRLFLRSFKTTAKGP